MLRCSFALSVLISLCGAASLSAAGIDLIQAVKNNDAAAVRSLLSQKADVNATEADGSTALHWAAQRDDLEIAGLLLNAGANATAATRYNITPLYHACVRGNARMIDLLLKAGADPNSTFQEGQTALMTASLTGNADAVKLLLTRGADVNAGEPYKGQTALMWAAGEGNAAAAELLIEFGAGVNAVSNAKYTPLLLAVRNGHREAAKTLLDHGANVNDAAPDGTSALNMAILNAHFDLAAMLLDHNANPNTNDPRASGLHILAWMRKPGTTGSAGVGGVPYGPPLPKGAVTSLELAQKLLDHGADPNVRVSWKERTFDVEGGATRNPADIPVGRHYLTYTGATAFYLAAKNGDIQLMRLLAEGGANPTTPNAFGVTPLMVAAGLDYWEGESPGPFAGVSEAERLEAVKFTVEHGNDIDAVADFGEQPAMEGDPEYTLLYYPHNVEKYVNIGMGDPRWSGCTPLHGAVVSGQPSIVQYLVDQGAKLDVKNKLGWTPLMVAEGVFFANAKKEFPQAAEIIKKALAEQGLIAAKQ